MENRINMSAAPELWDINIDDMEEQSKQYSTGDMSPDGALMKCLDECGAVKIDRICQLCGYEPKQVVEALRGTIIRDPEGWTGEYDKGFVLRDRYLSGDLLDKRRLAAEANKQYNGIFEENIDILDDILPTIATGRQVRVTLGAAWVPPQIIDSFIREALDICAEPNEHVRYDPVNCFWYIEYAARYKRHVRNISTYGTYEMPALRILEKTLNAQPVEVYKSLAAADDQRQLDKAKTALARSNQKRIIEKFDEWVFSDEQRTCQLYDCFDSVFGRVSNRKYDGRFLTLPEMNDEIKLFDHQLNAVARIVFNRNTLLAHDVGAGKTLTMIAAGQVLRRMGLSKKNLYVVPNAIMAQWEGDYRRAFPCANILVVDRKNFSCQKRQRTLELMRDGDFDAILITASSFALIPLSFNERIGCLRRQRTQLMSEMNGENVRKKLVLKELDRINERIDKLVEEMETHRILGKDEGICFDHLGVTNLFVDEAHEYKNITVKTRSRAVFGVSKKGSAKCDTMLDKVHFTQRCGRGAVFATATPVSNSITDIFVMQTYLQPGELRYLNLASFDNWSSTFARREESVELDVDGCSVKTITRLAHFNNMLQLSALFGQVADFHLEPSERNRDYETRNIEIMRTTEVKEYFKGLSKRADDVRSGTIDRTEDNLLKITIDGKKGALDLRVTGCMDCSLAGTKTFHCALEVCRIWSATQNDRLTQLVFCDISTPKKGFNVYDELKRLLMEMGVPGGEIAFIHDADSDSEKNKLFERVNNGDIRILVGSTRKLGTGVNVQSRLCAIHHMDAPFRPSDYIQREGRMFRRGNNCKQLHVFRYVTCDTFDAFSFQLLEIKQNFINQFLSGNIGDSSECDFDDIALTFSQVKALAVGDMRIREYLDAKNELDSKLSMQKAFNSHRRRINDELRELPEAIARQRVHVENLNADALTVAEALQEELADKEERRAFGEELLEALEDNVMRPEERWFDDFRGLRVILPANMLEEESLVILRGRENTVVKMGLDVFGNIRRLQLASDGLAERAAKAKDIFEQMLLRREQLEAELVGTDPYTDEIEELRDRVACLEAELTSENIDQ